MVHEKMAPVIVFHVLSLGIFQVVSGKKSEVTT